MLFLLDADGYPVRRAHHPDRLARPQQPPRVDPNPALMLVIVTQHDSDPHVASLPMKV
jgi:hypothetical protein